MRPENLIRGTSTSALVTPTSVFVGLNAGEWGGGLRRIDRKTGIVATFERKTAKRNCAEPLNSDCDPVNGVASLPWNDGCVGVAVGLVHMASRGRIVEVCGNSVRSFYSKTYALDPGIRDRLGPVPEDYFTVAFFGLAAANDALWAVGNDGIYQIRPNGSAEFTPLPSFEKVGNVFISFDRPDMVLVLTDINQRRSVSGSVPIMVPR